MYKTLLVLLLLIPMTTSADVINFNGLGTLTDDPVTVDGFVFDFIDRNGWAIGEAGQISNQVGNGTEFATCRDTNDFSCSISMMAADSSAFTLSQFDLADHSLGFGGQMFEVTYNLFGGGSISDSFLSVADIFATYTASAGSFSSVLFTWNGTFGNDGFGLDNIVVNAAAQVPEPATLVLLGLGLAGMGLSRKRQHV